MPLTEEQDAAIQILLNGDQGMAEVSLNGYLNAIALAREDLIALQRIGGNFADADIISSIDNSKLKVRTAADLLAALFA